MKLHLLLFCCVFAHVCLLGEISVFLCLNSFSIAFPSDAQARLFNRTAFQISNSVHGETYKKKTQKHFVYTCCKHP